tara:strand:- start:31627 stop:32313 length:687 start_codon:yes stop_codon:yes gene_type:complete
LKKACNNSTHQIRYKKKLFKARENKILDVTKALLLSSDNGSVTVSKIADISKIGKGTIYKHFLTKNQILVQIILDHEKQLGKRLSMGIKSSEEGQISAACKAYFEYRLAEPELDSLVQKLEKELIDTNDLAPQFEELHRIRRENQITLNRIFKKKQTEVNGDEEECSDFHYFACWALAQGAVELYLNKAHHQVDMGQLMTFIIEIGSTIGINNKFIGALQDQQKKYDS